MYFSGYAGLRPFIPLAEAFSPLNPLVNGALSLSFAAARVATRIGNFCSSYFSSRQDPDQVQARLIVVLKNSQEKLAAVVSGYFLNPQFKKD